MDFKQSEVTERKQDCCHVVDIMTFWYPIELIFKVQANI